MGGFDGWDHFFSDMEAMWEKRRGKGGGGGGGGGGGVERLEE